MTFAPWISSSQKVLCACCDPSAHEVELDLLVLPMLVPGGWRVSLADQADVWRLRSSPMQPLLRCTEVTHTWICHLYPVMAGHRAQPVGKDAAPGSSIQMDPQETSGSANLNQRDRVEALGVKDSSTQSWSESDVPIPASWKETRRAGGSERKCWARFLLLPHIWWALQLELI